MHFIHLSHLISWYQEDWELKKKKLFSEIVENVFTNKRKLPQSLNFVYKKLEPFQMLKVEEQKHDEITNIFL